MAPTLPALAAALGLAAAPCRDSSQCAEHFLCIRGACARAHTPAAAGARRGRLPDSCFDAWPKVQQCAEWYESGTERHLESNGVPPYYVPPYCPFGLGQGYCANPAAGNSTDCPPFRGKVCPCVPDADGRGCPAATPDSGDVLVPTYQHFIFPLKPDPTDARKPLHMYDNSALQTGNTYQVIGAHLNGVQLKGPAEANGFNVDTSLIPLPCGGHVTPPVGPGPIYHYHKASECIEMSAVGQHAPLIAYASDGFGIYGYHDVDGAPLLDECHGHFGPVDPSGRVEYHYHTSPEYNVPGKPHRPYYMGCQGPAKGRCNSTVSSKYDGGANWCGQGCGADICVQPGTSTTALQTYLNGFPGTAKWLDNFTVNDYGKRD
eukprot:TRINITY_DN156_c0_g2_i4.p2 TRINITY_DN156_c0_g2~~TRINITY_DN156_c0_g2_i4.p2  ORF type:complete len:399 (+),score=115.75 TRINITY_DN156_c0_g2_i4:74-1198(+)